MARTRRRYISIQVLRGFAALAIVFFHLSEMLLRYTDGTGLFCRAASLWQIGASGVDIFFIISGFVMVESTRPMFRQKGASLTFIIRRLIRIVPLYWLYSLLMLLLVLLPFTLRSAVFSPAYTLQSFFFIPARNPASNLPLPLLPQGWTLWYEMYFYILFAIFLLWDSRYLLPVLTLFFTGSVLAGTWFGEDGPVTKVLTNPLLLEFTLGCFLGRLVHTAHFSAHSSIFCIAVGCALLFLTQYLPSAVDYRLLVWGGPAFLIALGLVMLERQATATFPGLLTGLGDASYSLYLSHIFILLGVATLLKHHRMPQVLGNDLVALLTVLICILWSWFSLKMIEEKSLVFLRSRLLPPK